MKPEEMRNCLDRLTLAVGSFGEFIRWVYKEREDLVKEEFEAENEGNRDRAFRSESERRQMDKVIGELDHHGFARTHHPRRERTAAIVAVMKDQAKDSEEPTDTIDRAFTSAIKELMRRSGLTRSDLAQELAMETTAFYLGMNNPQRFTPDQVNELQTRMAIYQIDPAREYPQ